MRSHRPTHQGQVWTAPFPPPVGYRPCVLVSREDVCSGPRERVVVVTVTSRLRRLPSHVPLDEADSVDGPSDAVADELHTLHKSNLDKLKGRVRPEKLQAIGEQIAYALDLPAGGEVHQAPVVTWQRRLRLVAGTWVLPRSWVPNADDSDPKQVTVSLKPDGSLAVRIAATP